MKSPEFGWMFGGLVGERGDLAWGKSLELELRLQGPDKGERQFVRGKWDRSEICSDNDHYGVPRTPISSFLHK